MAHFHIKKKKGRPYLYVREIARVDGKPTVISQVYLGSPERVRAMAAGLEQEDLRLKVEEFGALWLATLMDQDIDLAGIVDSVVQSEERETGPSVGEYFLYSVFNHMIEAVSKRKLADWYRRTAIQHLRPVALDQLTSQRYWEKWDRVSEADVTEIARRFFSRVWELESPEADCFLFDTTNYYTFMSEQTASDLAARGRNKSGKHHLRQIGFGLLVARDSRLPLYYMTYPGNLHDSRLFAEVMEAMIAVICGLKGTKYRLTVVVDKGMNSDENYAWIDDHPRIHFVTTYSPHFAEELVAIPLERFEPVEIEKNRQLAAAGHPEERIMATRTRGEYWGKERSVVVTYTPATARKQAYMFDRKLEEIRSELLLMRARFRTREPHWRDPDTIRERYLRLCERLHIGSAFFDLEFSEGKKGPAMSFRKNVYRVEQRRARMGKTIIITDNTDWTTAEIVTASLDRWQVESHFRLSKDPDLVSVEPVRHWTDSKIRCHFLTCTVALTYLRRLERRLAQAGVTRTAVDVMDEMKHLHSVLLIPARARKPRRRIETPTKTQSEVLRALGYSVTRSGVLQALEE